MKNEKKNTCRYYHFTLVYHKWQRARQTKYFVILGYFLLFYPTNNQKNQNVEKFKKTPGENIILHQCTIYGNHMMYGSWDMKCNKQNFFVILGHFLYFYPANNPKNKNFETMKKEPGGIIILHKCTKNHDHPRQKITEILPLHSGIIVVISNK